MSSALTTCVAVGFCAAPLILLMAWIVHLLSGPHINSGTVLSTRRVAAHNETVQVGEMALMGKVAYTKYHDETRRVPERYVALVRDDETRQTVHIEMGRSEFTQVEPGWQYTSDLGFRPPEAPAVDQETAA